MKMTQKKDSSPYKVAVNIENKYLIWRSNKELPLGWRDAGMAGTKSGCLDYINTVSTDGVLADMNTLMESVPLVNPVELSEREHECLVWAASGKTAWETGQILGLSEWTVVYHLEKAKRKLGATNKRHAIACAIRLGILK